MQGANPSALETKIQQLYGSGDGDDEEDDGVAGHVCTLTYLFLLNCYITVALKQISYFCSLPFNNFVGTLSFFSFYLSWSFPFLNFCIIWIVGYSSKCWFMSCFRDVICMWLMLENSVPKLCYCCLIFLPFYGVIVNYFSSYKSIPIWYICRWI